jgi:hypothetical protein
MARLWVSGFELNSLTAEKEWSTITGSPTIQTSIKNGGSYALRANTNNAYVRKQIYGNGQLNQHYLKAAIYIAALPTSGVVEILGFGTSSVRTVTVGLNSNGKLGIYSDGTLQGSVGSTALNTGQWYTVELLGGYGLSTQREIRVNGSSYITATFTNTTSWTHIETGLRGTANGANIYIDDVVIDSSEYPGASRLCLLLPDGAGDSTQWTASSGSNYECVDDGNPNDDTDYVSTTLTNRLDLYTIGNMPESPQSIKAAYVSARFRTSDTNFGKIGTRVKEGGSTSNGGNMTLGAINSYRSFEDGSGTNPIYKQILTTKPSGGAWTESAINATQIGFNSTATSSPTLRVTMVWMYVEYVPQSATKYSVTKSLQYAVKKKTATTKSLQYAVKVPVAITKSLSYDANGTASIAITKSLKYCVATTPSAITKSAQYAVKTSVSKTKSLQYAVKSPVEVTKSLKYTVKTAPSALTKSLKYTVRTTPSALTKSLKYEVKITPSAITKSLRYAIRPSLQLTKSLKYTLKVTPPAKTKSLQYEVRVVGAITKSLGYAVKKSTAITKQLKYEVLAVGAITKSLRYAVKVVTAIQKSLQYYTVKPSPTAITKPLAYRVRKTFAITKSLVYTVKSSNEITKGITYTVFIEQDITKGLVYAVKTVTDITKELSYQVVTTRPVEITLGLVYTVLTTSEVTKGLSYSITAEIAITKGLQYTVKSAQAVTKALAYSILNAGNEITKALVYTVKAPHQKTLGLQYFVRVYPYHKKQTEPYGHKNKPYTQASSPFIRKGPPYTRKTERPYTAIPK